MRKFLTLTTALARVFDPGKSGWKLDAEGKIEMKDGNPIYLDNNGAEMTVNGDTISTLRNEAKQHREAAGTAIDKLKAYEKDGKLLDPATALKAIETVGKLDAKKLIDAGEVDKLTDQIKQQFTTQIAEKDKAFSELQSKYDSNQISNIFNNSEFVRNRVAVPHDMFEAAFRKNFKIEDGKIKAFDRDGNPLMSKKNMGTPATPDEALELLVDAHPQKDTIVKAITGNGSGSSGNGGGRGGQRTIARSEFSKLDGAQQAQMAALQAKGELIITNG